MILPRTLRRWTWRVNALVLVGAAVLWWQDATTPASSWTPEAITAKPRQRPSRSTVPKGRRDERRREFLQMLDRLHPSVPAPAEVAQADSPDGPLPMGAYEVPLIFLPGDRRPVVTLRSKVPGRRESHSLVLGQEEHGFLVESCVVEGTTAKVTVRRV